MRRVAHASFSANQVAIVEDSDCCLVVNAVISKVGVYDFPEHDGTFKRAFWSPLELLKAARTARAAKLTELAHPPDDPMPVVMSQSQMKGRVEKAFFDRDKIRARLNFDKHETNPAVLAKVRSAAAKEGPPLDVSIGFYYKSDNKPGTWKDEVGKDRPYDYTMRDMVIDHVACGVSRGRCSFPDCGIGVDTLMQGKIHVAYDTMEECIADNQDKENPAGFCAWLLKQTGVCTQEQVDAFMKREKERTKKMSEDPKEAFIKAKMKDGLSKEEAEAQYLELTKKPDGETLPPAETPPAKAPPPADTPPANTPPPAVETPPPPPTVDELVERTSELLEMKAEKDLRNRSKS